MGKTDKPILDVLQGRLPNRRPVWLMRQAGRYLPEYRELRAKSKNFLNMCLTPELATEITLQPIRRFDMDAAIIFADILLIPMALGVPLEFREGEGPVLQKTETLADILKLDLDDRKIAPVYETLRRVKKELPQHTALIGFCGAPWTVACYMIDGNSKQDFALSKTWLQHKPYELQKLIDILVESSFAYLSKQIEAGAEVLQIFDSWAGLLDGDNFKKYVIEPTRKLAGMLKSNYPHIPLIGFPREAGQNYGLYAKGAGVDAVGLDQQVDIVTAKRNLQSLTLLQGNLSPDLLVQGGKEMTDALQKIMTGFGPRHIVNLGHGVVPQTPPEHVEQMVECVHNFPVDAKTA